MISHSYSTVKKDFWYLVTFRITINPLNPSHILPIPQLYVLEISIIYAFIDLPKLNHQLNTKVSPPFEWIFPHVPYFTPILDTFNILKIINRHPIASDKVNWIGQNVLLNFLYRKKHTQFFCVMKKDFNMNCLKYTLYRSIKM